MISDLENRLAALHIDTPTHADDDIVAADLRRGRAALASRRHRRAAVAGAATVGLVAAGSLSYALTSDGGRSKTPDAVGPAPAPRMTSSSPAVISPPTTRPTHSKAATPALELVFYSGKQLPGYTVDRIPEGYVLQGISGSVLDVSEKGDHSSLDTFVGKIVVMINDHPGADRGPHVSVNGRPGRIDNQGGVQILTYRDHGRYIDVQSWSNVHITPEQLVRFAEGVTVLPNAQEGHG